VWAERAASTAQFTAEAQKTNTRLVRFRLLSPCHGMTAAIPPHSTGPFVLRETAMKVEAGSVAAGRRRPGYQLRAL